MSRIYWMVLTLAILAIFALYTNWFANAVRNDQQNKLDQNTVVSSQEVAAEQLPDSRRVRIELDTQTVDIRRGDTIDIPVYRSGDLGQLQLGLHASLGSHLLLSGGYFKKGELLTNISIQAPKEAESGTVQIIAAGKAQFVTVTVLP